LITRPACYLALPIALAACHASPGASSPSSGAGASFEDEVAFLQRYGAVLVLESPDGGRIAVSGQYQARVMTSAVGPGEKSLGYVNHAFIESRKTGTPFDNYGGEDRFWLGPEGGQFGLYFPPGAPYDMAHWQTPPPLQEGAWPVREKGTTDVVFEQALNVKNWSGTAFDTRVRRTIRVLGKTDVRAELGVDVPAGVRFVAFETKNELQNYGGAWTKDAGLLSVWILGQYVPAPDMHVIVPFEARGDGEIVNDRYFGKVPAERLTVDTDGAKIVFLCDGNYRSKIGLRPSRAKDVLGSYSRAARTLTIVRYNKAEGMSDYVNSMWAHQDAPYGGDVVNSYNDGPTEPGKPSLGGFYELETSSPALPLARQGASYVHVHSTFHFVGDEDALDAIATKVLGVSLRSLP
jgi:hypothetical protein